MSYKLLIVESPTKAKTINKYLGKEYKVIASYGHIRDLPEKELGVDEKTFLPTYTINTKYKKKVTEIKKLYKDASEVYLATDLDREGEAISWHIDKILKATKIKEKPISRITFNSITKKSILEALEKPREIDINLVDAQQGRRIIDRLVGYKISPIIWKKIRYGLSAGRVQSVALRIIVEREELRNAFIKQTYFTFPGEFDEKLKFKSELFKIDSKKLIENNTKTKKKSFLIKTEEEAKKIKQEIQDSKFTIESINEKTVNRKTYPPFTTSLLQQACSNVFGFTAKRTMSAAQKLYEQGLITYHRTDSFSINAGFLKEVHKKIKEDFGNDYLQENSYKTKSKNAQEAHEAIRPTNINLDLSNKKLLNDQRFVYELIKTRTLASQMSPIIKNSKNLIIKSDNDKFIFKTLGNSVIFKGWAKVYEDNNTLKYSPLSSDNLLPDVKVNEQIKLINIEKIKNETTPPNRYTEASLIKLLEKHGIGRPSTYAPTINTLLTRKYVEKANSSLIPTDIGIVVNKFMRDNFAEIIDYNFTAKVEEKLDEVAEGRKKYLEEIKIFYEKLNPQVIQANDNKKREDYTILKEAPENIKCPICEKKMNIRLSRGGKFMSCVTFPECKGARDEEGKTKEENENLLSKQTTSKEFTSMYKKAPKTEKGEDFKLKKGRYGQFWAHPDYPKVKDARPLEYKEAYIIEKFGEAPKTEDKRDFNFRTGKWGNYWAHPDYPKVKKTIKIKK